MYRYNKKSKDRRFTSSKKSCEMRIESLVPRFHDAWWIIVTQCHVHFSPYKLYRTSKSVSRRLCISRFINRCETAYRLERYFDDGKTFEFSRRGRLDDILRFHLSCAHFACTFASFISTWDNPDVGLVEDHHFWGGISGNSGPRGWARTWLVNPEIRPVLSVFPH